MNREIQQSQGCEISTVAPLIERALRSESEMRPAHLCGQFR